jgi:phosphoribosylformylglycinamidine cyclo-ligase
VPPIFSWLQQAGRVPGDDMYRTFNMGIGLILVCAAADEPSVLAALTAAGETPLTIGEVRSGGSGVHYVA